MIWVVFVAVVLAVFVVLNLSAYHTTLDNMLFGMDITHGTGLLVMVLLLLGCVFLLFKLTQFCAHTLLMRVAQWLMGGCLCAMIVMLFIIRTMSVEQNFADVARLIPQQGYTITADVSVRDISDGIYDEGMYYRQKAFLSDLQFEHGSNSDKKVQNPFGITNDTAPPHVPLPNQLTVLLQAPPLSPLKHNTQDITKSSLTQLSHLKPNTHVKMTLFITPLNRETAAANTGFDGQRWLRTRHVHAYAKVIAVHGEVTSLPQTGMISRLEHFRQVLREHFYHRWHHLSVDEQQVKAVTLSLLTGDRALISRTTKELYQFGGISHLLAISGTHVVFLAMILAYALCYVTDRFLPFYHRLPRHHFRKCVMIGASLLYALFTGFDVPAVRTVYMLIAVATVSYLGLPVSSFVVLAWVALLMIWLDPVMVWQAGFWLSFVAVALLMSYGEQEFEVVQASIKDRLVGLIKLQSYLFIAMLPISLVLFGKVSLWGLVVNLFAVGLFGMVIVPINLLAGVLFMVLPSVADVLWHISTFILAHLNDLLFALQDVGDAWLHHSMGVTGVALLVLAILVWVNPIISRVFAMIPLLGCVMMLNNEQMTAPFRVDVLEGNGEVSQVLIRQQGADDSMSGEAIWLVLSDFTHHQDAKKFAQILLDGLYQKNVRHLTGVIVQNPSAMMSQALAIIHEDIPIYHYWQAGRDVPTIAGLPQQRCEAGQSWRGDGLTVTALTGWQMIDDEHVWGCTVLVESELVARVQGGIHHQPTIGVRKLVVNGATHTHTWALYEALCREDVPSVDVWLGHSRHVVSVQSSALFAPRTVIYTDNNTAANQDKTAATMMSMMDDQ